MGKYHFFLIDLLSGDLTIIARNFGETIPSFLWLKNNNSVVLTTRIDSKNKWIITIYNFESNLSLDIKKIRGKEIRLLSLSPNGKKVCFEMKKRGKKQLFQLNFETKKLTKVYSKIPGAIKNCLWAKNEKLFLQLQNKRRNNRVYELSLSSGKIQKVFDQPNNLKEELVGITKDKTWIYFNIQKANYSKCGAFNILTNEINWLPEINQEIKAISTNGQLVLLKDTNKEVCELLEIKSYTKRTVPIVTDYDKLEFCIDDEFLVFLDNQKDNQTMKIHDLMTDDIEPVAEIEVPIFGYKKKMMFL